MGCKNSPPSRTLAAYLVDQMPDEDVQCPGTHGAPASIQPQGEPVTRPVARLIDHLVPLTMAAALAAVILDILIWRA